MNRCPLGSPFAGDRFCRRPAPFPNAFDARFKLAEPKGSATGLVDLHYAKEQPSE